MTDRAIVPVQTSSVTGRPPVSAGTSLPVFKALADATRLGIFLLIAAHDEPLCACEIVDRFTVSQPTIAHHLRTLREAGLITAERRGVWVYYAVDRTGVDRLGDVVRLVTGGS